MLPASRPAAVDRGRWGTPWGTGGRTEQRTSPVGRVRTPSSTSANLHRYWPGLLLAAITVPRCAPDLAERLSRRRTNRCPGLQPEPGRGPGRSALRGHLAAHLPPCGSRSPDSGDDMGSSSTRTSPSSSTGASAMPATRRSTSVKGQRGLCRRPPPRRSANGRPLFTDPTPKYLGL